MSRRSSFFICELSFELMMGFIPMCFSFLAPFQFVDSLPCGRDVDIMEFQRLFFCGFVELLYDNIDEFVF